VAVRTAVPSPSPQATTMSATTINATSLRTIPNLSLRRGYQRAA
jgi:hypothetical protein